MSGEAVLRRARGVRDEGVREERRKGARTQRAHSRTNTSTSVSGRTRGEIFLDLLSAQVDLEALQQRLRLRVHKVRGRVGREAIANADEASSVRANAAARGGRVYVRMHGRMSVGMRIDVSVAFVSGRGRGGVSVRRPMGAAQQHRGAELAPFDRGESSRS